MADTSLAFADAVHLAGMIRDRQLGSVELTRFYIDRIERFDREVNAVVVRDFDRALAAAHRAAEALARGERFGPLHGLPVTVKEGYDVQGLATTWGVPTQRGNVARTDAEVVRRLRAAGAVVLGKTNVPLMLGDFQSYNDLYGTTNNPWDPARVPGGSSGGSAAALAAGLTALECGSDLGGSIRGPAHYCGVYGHKPTWGIVPRDGHELPDMALAQDMAVFGPLARSARDLALALETIAGPGPLESPGWKLELPPPRRTSLRGLRVAVWPTDSVSPVDDELAGRVERLAALLASHGAVVSDRARPAFDPAALRRVYVALVNAMAGAAASDAQHEENRRRAASFDPADQSKPAVIARTLVLDHRAWLANHAERMKLRRAWKAFFEEWDVLLCPTAATVAFPHDHRPIFQRTVTVNGAPQGYFDQVFWAALASVAHLPATVFPTGPSASGLPIGLQLIGAEFADHTTIEVARLIAEVHGGFVAPPRFAA